MVQILQRIAQALATLLVLLVLVFVLTRLTGDPARLMLPIEATPEEVAAFRQEHGFDLPIPAQLARYLGSLVRGDLGQSLYWKAPVAEVVLARLPATLQLGGAAILLVVLFGIPLGVLSAVHRGGWVDYVCQLVALLGQSVPVFVTGLFLILIFGVELKWLPIAGAATPLHLVLPAVTLASFSVAALVRITRSAMLDVLDADYVRTARAKGLGERAVVASHALRNALIPILTLLGIQLATLLTGAVVTETLFAWPGLGRVMVEAILARDYPVVQGAVLVTATIFVFTNLAVDLLYTRVDPRVRTSGR